MKMKKINKNMEGFSLLELVVAVGVLLVLTVGGLLAYNGITKNARQAAVNNAAETVYNMTIANSVLSSSAETGNFKTGTQSLASIFNIISPMEINNVPDNAANEAANEWMKNSDGSIDVRVSAIYTGTICVTAYWKENPAIIAKEGSCTPANEENPPTVVEDGYVWGANNRTVNPPVNNEQSGMDSTTVQYNSSTGTSPNGSTVRITANLLSGNSAPVDFEGDLTLAGGDFELESVSADKKTYVFVAHNVRDTATLNYSWNSRYFYDTNTDTSYLITPKIELRMSSDDVNTTTDTLEPTATVSSET